MTEWTPGEHAVIDQTIAAFRDAGFTPRDLEVSIGLLRSQLASWQDYEAVHGPRHMIPVAQVVDYCRIAIDAYTLAAERLAP